mmetsp:Transcript_32349/g.28642  ORF Transcript_32349/g.28642 Transcript_32349/m.28642 type:complete len:321 (+) Transcript_32349:909-1871(+)
MRLKFVLDSESILIERKIYTVYNMIGQVGGFMGIVVSVAGILAGIFSNNVYIMTLLSYFYKVNTMKYTSKIILKKLLPKMFSRNENKDKFNFTITKILEESKNELPNKNIIRVFPKKKASPKDEFEDENYDWKSRNELFHRLKTKLLNREWYKFKWRNVMYTLLCCPRIRCKKRQTILNKNFKDYTLGSDKLVKELDLISIIEALRKVNMMADIMFDQNQKILTQNQSVNFINREEEKDLQNPKDEYLILKNEELEEKLNLMKNNLDFNLGDSTNNLLINNILEDNYIKNCQNLQAVDVDVGIYKNVFKRDSNRFRIISQ